MQDACPVHVSEPAPLVTIFTPAVLAFTICATCKSSANRPPIDSTGLIPPYPDARLRHGYTATLLGS
jgi:hypothetical protein